MTSAAPAPTPSPAPAVAQELNLLNPVDTQKVGTDLVDHLNTLADPTINNISQKTRDEMNKVLGITGGNIISAHAPNTGKDIFKLAVRLHEPHDDLSTAARKEIHDKILSRLPTKTTDSVGTEYSIANSVNEIKGRILDGKEEREAKEQAEKDKKEHDEKHASEAKFKALPFSDQLRQSPRQAVRENAIAVGSVAAGLTAFGGIAAAAPTAIEKFVTNFPIVAEYTQLIGSTLGTITEGVGLNALVGASVAPFVAAVPLLTGLGYTKRKMLESFGKKVPKYHTIIGSGIGNTFQGLKLLVVDIPLLPFRAGQVGLNLLAKSKGLKPSKLGIAAAAIGIMLAPWTGGASLGVGFAGYVGGNLYSHNKKEESHGGQGHGDTRDTHEHGGDDHDSD